MLKAHLKKKKQFSPGILAKIIYLKERNLAMLKNDLILRNPLRLLGRESEEIIGPGGFGAALARAGVGKTAFLVQLSLDSLLRSKKVLHISLNDPVDKVGLWYKELFQHLAEQYDATHINRLWEDTLPHRFIMTFKVEGFSVPKLEERLTDLTQQGIFKPQMVIIDGFPFDATAEKSIIGLKALAKEHAMQVWFTIQTHREEALGPDGMPNRLTDILQLFDAVIQLQPKGNEIHVVPVKGAASAEQTPLLLDPSTMLIQDRG